MPSSQCGLRMSSDLSTSQDHSRRKPLINVDSRRQYRYDKCISKKEQQVLGRDKAGSLIMV